MSLSAQRIGKMFGLTAQEMNMALKLLGYLDGEPGHYLPTVKCKPFYLQEYHDNGYRVVTLIVHGAPLPMMSL